MTEQAASVAAGTQGEPAKIPETPGTATAAGTQGSEKEPDYKALYLQAKTKVEGYNELERKVKDLERRAQQSPAAVVHADARGQRLVSLRKLATEFDDPASQELLELREELAQTIAGVAALRELDQIADQQERDATLKHFQENSHRFADIKGAHAEVRRAKLESEREAQQAEIVRLAAELKRLSSKPDPNVARTATREVPAHEHEVRLVTIREFDSQIEQLRREGKHSQVMALQNQLAKGEIDFKDQ